MNKLLAEQRHGVKLTDSQWDIVLEEVRGRDDQEGFFEVLDDVVLNIESYEQEHAWWNALKNAS